MNRSEIVWPAMTAMSARENVEHIAAAAGVNITNRNGQVSVSGNAGLWNCSLGYSRPEIRSAIVETLDTLPYASLFRSMHQPAEDLAERLLSICPDDWHMARVVYACSGSSAVDTALRFAHRYHVVSDRSRSKLAAMASSYHGTTSKAQSVSGENLGQEAHGVDRSGTILLDVPGSQCSRCRSRCEGGCVDHAISQLEPHADDLAAFIVEPILGSAGVIEIPPAWLAGVTRWCRDHDVLVIADEVATGFGRTGQWFAWERVPIGPDLLVCSKAINAGYLPLAAIVLAKRVTTLFEDLGADFVQGETQAGNPMACSAGVAAIDVAIELELGQEVRRRQDVLTDSIRRVEPLIAGIDDAIEPHAIARLEGRGLMLGVHLAPRFRHLAPQVYDRCLRSGVVVHPSALGISLFPPLVIGDDDLQFVGEVVGEAVSSAVRRHRVGVAA